jgi:hypothetical protein
MMKTVTYKESKMNVDAAMTYRELVSNSLSTKIRVDTNPEFPLALITDANDDHDGMGIAEMTNESPYTAALMTLRWNNHDKLLEILKAITKTSTTISNLRHAGIHIDNCLWSRLHQEINEAKSIIQKTETHPLDDDTEYFLEQVKDPKIHPKRP